MARGIKEGGREGGGGELVATYEVQDVGEGKDKD